MAGVRIAGTGAFVPDNVISNEALASLIEPNAPGKNARWAREKLGIAERRTMEPLDASIARVGDHELELALLAARAAVTNAGIVPEAIDGIWYVSCTQSGEYARFSRTAFALHAALGLRPDAFVLEMDAGCGGATYAMGLASKLISGGGGENCLVVAANAPSKYLCDWQKYVRSGAWLSMYIFGDGAGAILLQRSTGAPNDCGILATYIGVDPSMPLMQYSTPSDGAEPLFLMDSRAVSMAFRRYARQALEALQVRHPFRGDEIRRFYFHQVNGNILRNFTEELAIEPERVALHVHKYGNLAAASTLVLLDEDVRGGLIGPGDLCVFCTVGAGAQYGAMLVRL